MNTTEYAINHLDCASCSMTIEDIAERQPEVSRAEVNARKRQLTVSHGDAFNSNKLMKALTAAGYPVAPIHEGSITSQTDNADQKPRLAGPIDPVCGMSVTADAEYHDQYNGITYYFCSANCHERFHNKPEEFIKNSN